MYLQYLQHICSVFIDLRQQAQRERRHSIMAPGAIQRIEQTLVVLVLQIPQPLSQVGQFRRSNQDDIQVLDHDTSKLQVLVLLQNISNSAVDTLWIQTHTQLPDNQTPSCFQ